MSHVTYTLGNWVYSWLLVVWSQTGISFDHNLCFKCPNGSYEPILNIYVSIAFKWYEELFEPMGFDPCNCSMKIWESIWDSNFHNGSSLRSVKVHSFTFFTFFALFALLGTFDVIPGLLLGLQPCNPLPWSRACEPRIITTQIVKP
jgi:hypothetical protein